ncbi:MAG TPA: Uma2 family endonuclease [Thermoanaerobaculia bacterium]|jgi:Uma2 family endonuclease
MTSQTATKLTYDDYAAMPDDGQRYELIEGELVLNPAPILKHQVVTGRIYARLLWHVEKHGAGLVVIAPTDVVLSPENVLQPDVLFVSKARASILTRANVQGAPDLVVETLSDGTRRRDENVKRRLYERYGVAEYWVVDPEADTVRVFRRDGDRFTLAAQLYASNDDVLTTPLLPGLQVELREVFEYPLP